MIVQALDRLGGHTEITHHEGGLRARRRSCARRSMPGSRLPRCARAEVLQVPGEAGADPASTARSGRAARPWSSTRAGCAAPTGDVLGVRREALLEAAHQRDLVPAGPRGRVRTAGRAGPGRAGSGRLARHRLMRRSAGTNPPPGTCSVDRHLRHGPGPRHDAFAPPPAHGRGARRRTEGLLDARFAPISRQLPPACCGQPVDQLFGVRVPGAAHQRADRRRVARSPHRIREPGGVLRLRRRHALERGGGRRPGQRLYDLAPLGAAPRSPSCSRPGLVAAMPVPCSAVRLTT